MLNQLRASTVGVFGVNFLVPFVDLGAVEAAASRARVVELFYGEPDPGLVARIHQGGALASWQVGSADEGLAAADAGCDLVIAQGIEAGGHMRGELPLLTLLDQILERVGVPVVAAGGIGTASMVATVLAAGAAAVRIGTRFVASDESGAHPTYIDALRVARAADTVVTTAFSVGWPDAPHRVLRSCVEAAAALPDAVVGEEHLGTTVVPVGRFTPPPPGRTFTGAIEAMALYAGLSVDAVQRTQPAAEIIAELLGNEPSHARSGAS
jgi:NAD(P)H-dependent flavin oxidoreductase YrpB (nitropropane dioxygenase family)